MEALDLKRRVTVPAEVRSLQCPGTDQLGYHKVSLWNLRFHEQSTETLSAGDSIPGHCRRRRLVVVVHFDSEMRMGQRSCAFSRRQGR